MRIIDADSFSTLMVCLFLLLFAVVRSFWDIYKKKIYKSSCIFYFIQCCYLLIDAVIVLLIETTNWGYETYFRQWNDLSSWIRIIIVTWVIFVIALYYQWKVLDDFGSHIPSHMWIFYQRLIAIFSWIFIVVHSAIYMIVCIII